jgi:hypothetical protein
MKQLSVVVFIFTFFCSISSAQETCKVLQTSIEGTYTGDCAGGKANGKGKSVGIDTYDGEFKAGFPEGAGTYTWANGSTYIGSFKKGKMEGKGQMNFKTAAGKDSVLIGFWKKDKYVGEFEFPYQVKDQSGRVAKVNISLISKGDKTGNINISSSQAVSSAVAGSNAVPIITEISVIAGQYISKTASVLSKTSVIRLQQMIFPFRARFVYNTGDVFEAVFNEKGDYEVTVNLQ